MTFAAAPLKTEIFGTPTNADANAGFGKLWDMITGLWGILGTPEAARSAMKMLDSQAIFNLRPVFSFAANAMTITMKDRVGTDLSADNPAYANMRHATAGDGGFNERKTSANIATAISAGSTGGLASATPGWFTFYLIDNAGPLELAWSNTYFAPSGVITTITEGGAGAADSSGVMYSTTGRSNVPYRAIFRAKVQHTTGNWTVAPTIVEPLPFEQLASPRVVENVLDANNDRLHFFDWSAQEARETTIANLLSGAGGIQVRQSVQSAAVDANGYSAAISAGAGLRLALDASPTSFVLAAAAGWDSVGKTLDAVEAVSADSSDIIGADLSASNTSYVYRTIGSAWGRSLVPPQYGYAFSKSDRFLCRWTGADAATSTTEDHGHAVALTGNAQVDTGILLEGNSTLLLDGAANSFATCTTFTSFADGSWEWIVPFRVASGLGSSIQLANATNAGGFGVIVGISAASKLEMYASSTGSSFDIENGTDGATTIVAATAYRARVTFDALAGSLKLYLSSAGGAESTERTVATTARVCSITSLRYGANASGTERLTGSIGAVRIIPAVSSTSAVTPSGSPVVITALPQHFFSRPEMKMYEITAASASAGVNPGMAQVNRLFVAEADTSGAAITAVRNYAIRAEYLSPLTTIQAVNTPQNFNHNIGVVPEEVRLTLVARLDNEGYRVGERGFPQGGFWNGSSQQVTSIVAATKLTATGVGGSTDTSAPYQMGNKTNGTRMGIGAANWNQQMLCRRGW